MSEYQLPEGFKPVSFQDIFNAAWQAFIVEDKPPASVMKVPGRTTCVYLTEDGRKCAVGLCIPDGHPAQRWVVDFHTIVNEFPELWADDIKNASGQELDDFQRGLHDKHIQAGTTTWGVNLDTRRADYIQLAKHYNLIVPGESDVQG